MTAGPIPPSELKLFDVNRMPTQREREARLDQIRRAAKKLVEHANPAREPGAFPHATPQTGYYSLPLIKPAPWSWEISAYFFAGGIAGASAIIANAAKWIGRDRTLASDARWLAAIGGAISPVLLTADLGRPLRFFNMLRVFKPQSPMSVGSWTLAAFSSSAAAAAFFGAYENGSTPVRVLVNAADTMAAATGLVLATYTGVLIGATAVPVWKENVSILPIHFGMSGLAAATSVLELVGHTSPALNTAGLLASVGETIIGAKTELNKNRVMTPLKKGKSGWLTRIGGLLSGPVPLVLRLLAGNSAGAKGLRLRRAAAVSSIAGSLITRTAWISAGKASTEDPTLQLDQPASSPKTLNKAESVPR